MITCKECKFWNVVPDGPNSHITTVNYQYCTLNGSKFLYNPYTEDICTSDSLIYWDKASYAASFQTGPDFGCIHGKSKE
jgi:hypothetical protein